MPADQLLGLLSGLGAACAQSTSYLFSRRFMLRTGQTAVLLLIMAQIIMGAAALIILPLLRVRNLPPFTTYMWPLAGSAFFYLAAQFGLFLLLRKVESSRVSPLLGMKIVVLAFLSILIMHQTLSPLQWGAVALCAGAAWLLKEAGGRIPWTGVLTLALTITGYCLSDINITILVQRLAPTGLLAPIIGACFSYLLCAAVMLPFIFRKEALSLGIWRSACPYALAWFGAMCLLYICFSLIGVVFGNIVQSTRGMISIALGWLVAHLGHTHLESRAPRAIFWRRMGGAALMTAAITLYLTSR